MLKEVIILFTLFAAYLCDTPGNCTFGEVQGKWDFFIKLNKKGSNDIPCSDGKSYAKEDGFKMEIDLKFPDVAMDQYGNKGFWTMIYNQGFEVVVNGRKYFAFSKYTGKGENATSYCGETMEGWSHDLLGRTWMCFSGKKQVAVPPKVAQEKLKFRPYQDKLYKANADFIEKINSVQSLWQAAYYEEYESMTVKELMRRAGGKAHRNTGVPKADVSPVIKKLSSFLPTNFDWRDINGRSFVSPVRNQGSCGSCYAFSSMGMLEARVLIANNGSWAPVFSPQDVVECSEYSQGCDGGFPYLIGGKYAEDFGVVMEEANPYSGKPGSCSTPKDTPRIYATGYKYVGGYYGACNEEEMKVALYNNGPMSVSFEVEDDFFHYKGGIYKHTGLKDKFNPFELTNHAVLLVGWGEEDGTPYWIVKNSWGEQWGEKGFFRIIRGEDECAIESIAVETFPIF